MGRVSPACTVGAAEGTAAGGCCCATSTSADNSRQHHYRKSFEPSCVLLLLRAELPGRRSLLRRLRAPQLRKHVDEVGAPRSPIMTTVTANPVSTSQTGFCRDLTLIEEVATCCLVARRTLVPRASDDQLGPTLSWLDRRRWCRSNSGVLSSLAASPALIATPATTATVRRRLAGRVRDVVAEPIDEHHAAIARRTSCRNSPQGFSTPGMIVFDKVASRSFRICHVTA